MCMEDRYIAMLILAGMALYFWIVSEREVNNSNRRMDEWERKNLENKIDGLSEKLDQLQNKTPKIKSKVQKPPSKAILRNRLINSVRKQLKGFEDSDFLLDEWSMGYVYEISNTIARRIYKLDAVKDNDKYTSSVISYIGLIYKIEISEAVDIFEEMSDLNGNSTVFDKGMQVASYDAGSYIDINTEFTGWFNYLNGK